MTISIRSLRLREYPISGGGVRLTLLLHTKSLKLKAHIVIEYYRRRFGFLKCGNRSGMDNNPTLLEELRNACGRNHVAATWD